MAQLKDTTVSGSLTATGTVSADVIKTNVIRTHSASNSTTISAGTDGQILKSNGTDSYWGSVTLDDVVDGTNRKLSDYAPLASPALTGTPTAPTATAGTNTTQIATTAFVKDAVNTAVGSVYRVKGTKASYANLPSSGNVTGDVWNVTSAYGNYPAGTNWVWTGSEWDALGGAIDLSVKQDVLTFDTTPTANSTNPVTSGGVYDAITANELVTSIALNDLNDRVTDNENSIDALQDDSVWEAGAGTNSVIIKGSLGSAAGNYSTVEGKGCVTGGTHTTYDLTIDTADDTAGSYAHAEGRYTIACGKKGSHAEGDRTLASGPQSHAEGVLTVASGDYSHAEGDKTAATDYGAHAEGYNTISSSTATHAEGEGTVASGTRSHAEGYRSKATAFAAHAEGTCSSAIGSCSHAEGVYGMAIGSNSHSETLSCAYGARSHSETGNKGVDIFPVGAANATSYTSTWDTEFDAIRNVIGDTVFCNILKASFIIPKNLSNYTEAVRITNASLSSSTLSLTTEKTLSETALDGSVNYWICFSIAYGDTSHTENSGNIAYGEDSHAEGGYNIAQGKASHAEGWFTYTNNVSEHAEGSYNASTKTSTTYGNAGNTQHSIGIGTASARKNAFEIMQNGDAYLYGVGGYTGANYSSASTLQTVISNSTLESLTTSEIDSIWTTAMS